MTNDEPQTNNAPDPLTDDQIAQWSDNVFAALEANGPAVQNAAKHISDFLRSSTAPNPKEPN